MISPTRAERELEWFFGVGASAMGLHAQSYEATGGGVWDSERIESVHVALRDPRHRDDVDRYRRISARLGRLDPLRLSIIVARYAAYPWPVMLRSVAGSVVGVTVLTLAARKAYARRHDGREPEVSVLRDWLALEATTPQRVATFRPIVAEARRMVAVALEAWGT